MRLSRQQGLLVTLVAVAALALPAMSSASELQVPAGTRAKVGTKLTLSAFVHTTGLYSEAYCNPNPIKFQLELVKNDGFTVEARGSTAYTTACQIFETEFHFRNIKLEKLFSTTAKFTKPANTILLSFEVERPFDERERYCAVSAEVPFTSEPGYIAFRTGTAQYCNSLGFRVPGARLYETATGKEAILVGAS